MQQQLVGMGPIGNRLHGGWRVGRPAFGGLGDADDPLNHVMLLARSKRSVEQFGRETPVGRRDRLELGARDALGSAGFVEIDVRTLRR